MKRLAYYQKRPGAGLIASIVASMITCIQSVLKVFSTYAFVYCAIYEMDFCSAGKAVFSLFEEKGICTSKIERGCS